MTKRIAVFDDSTLGKEGVPLPGFTDYDTDTNAEGQTVFSAAKIVNGAQKIDVFENGRMKREGVDYDRDYALHRVTTTYTVYSSWVRVRVYHG